MIQFFVESAIEAVKQSVSDVLTGICNICIIGQEKLGYGVELIYRDTDFDSQVEGSDESNETLDTIEIYGDFFDIVKEIQFVYELNSPTDAVLMALSEWKRSRFSKNKI